MFDWEDLRYFSVFAQEQSLSAAARKLKVDHATVARRISALEASLNLKLVDRRPRSYELTADGERIAKLGKRMEVESFAVERSALAGQAGAVGEVTVSAPPALACSLIAPHLGKLRQEHPQLSLQLLGNLGSASLTRREADVAIRLSRPTEPDFVARKVATIAFALYGSADYLDRTPADQLTFIAYDESMEQTTQQVWLLKQAADRPILLRSNDLNIQAMAAKAGVGLAALPYFLGEQYSLKPAAISGPALEREVWLVTHNDIRHTASVQAVMTFLAQCLAPPV
ncbi:HTH-type transcriptional regulator DmlR [compost metagenome]